MRYYVGTIEISNYSMVAVVAEVVCEVYSLRSTEAITIQKSENMASWISARFLLSPGKELQISL